VGMLRLHLGTAPDALLRGVYLRTWSFTSQEFAPIGRMLRRMDDLKPWACA
jgi:hypothetical protein